MINFVLLSTLERVPLGARSFSPNFFGLDDLAGASLVAGGVSALGSLFGSNSANKTNMKINQQNIDFQREMWDKQVAYNTEMWNKQNEYNNPSAEVERLKAAGINPAFAMSNISTGSGVAQSAPSVGSPQSIPAQPLDFSQLGRPFEQYLASKMQEEQINNAAKQGALLDAQTDKTRGEAEVSKANAVVAMEMAKGSLANLLEEVEGKRSSREYLNHQIPYIGRKTMAETLQAEQGVDMGKINLQSLQMDLKMKDLNLRFLPEQIKQNLALIAQQINTELAKQSMSYAQAKAAIKQAVLLGYQADGQKIENWKADNLAWDILERSRIEIEGLQRQDRWNKWQESYEHSPLQKFGRLVQMTNDKYNPLSGLIKMFK